MSPSCSLFFFFFYILAMSSSLTTNPSFPLCLSDNSSRISLSFGSQESILSKWQEEGIRGLSELGAFLWREIAGVRVIILHWYSCWKITAKNWRIVKSTDRLFMWRAYTVRGHEVTCTSPHTTCSCTVHECNNVWIALGYWKSKCTQNSRELVKWAS